MFHQIKCSFSCADGNKSSFITFTRLVRKSILGAELYGIEPQKMVYWKNIVVICIYPRQSTSLILTFLGLSVEPT